MKTLGDKIKTIRKEKKFTQLQLAKGIESSEAAISQYETGKRQPDWDTLQKIAKVLDVSITIFFDTENKEGNSDGDLLEVLKKNNLKWGKDILTHEEKERAIEILRVIFNKKST